MKMINIYKHIVSIHFKDLTKKTSKNVTIAALSNQTDGTTEFTLATKVLLMDVNQVCPSHSMWFMP